MRTICEIDKDACCKYYENQCGSGIDIYRASPIQGGAGLASIFGSLRSAIPLIKNIAKRALPHLLRTGLNVAGDVAGGENVFSAIKDRGLETMGHIFRGSNKKPAKKPLKGNQKRRRKVVTGKRAKRKLDQSSAEAY